MSKADLLADAVAGVAAGAGEALRRMSAADALSAEAKSARELCALLKDALALERELRAGERAAALTVRFEGAAEEASV